MYAPSTPTPTAIARAPSVPPIDPEAGGGGSSWNVLHGGLGTEPRRGTSVMLVPLVVVLPSSVLTALVLAVTAATFVLAIVARIRMLLALMMLVSVRLELVRRPPVLLPMKQTVAECERERTDPATDGPPLLRLRHHRRVTLRAKREAAS